MSVKAIFQISQVRDCETCTRYLKQHPSLQRIKGLGVERFIYPGGPWKHTTLGQRLHDKAQKEEN